MDIIKFTQEKLSLDSISEEVLEESCGAVSVFAGVTRNNFQDKKVVRLEYEAYEPMAVKSLKSICAEIRTKWDHVHHIAIYHRLGNVPVKETSVVIAISSPHRAESLEAVAFCIDQLKASVPIWKKEIYDDGGVTNDKPKGPFINEKHNKSPFAESTKVDMSEIDPNLIQIKASNVELQERINNFIRRKREQVNVSNIHDFIPSARQTAPTTDTNCEIEETDNCARVRTLFVKRTDSTSHLKVHRVNNEWGPQTKRQTQPQKRRTSSETSSLHPPRTGLPTAIEERVLNIEKYLSIPTPISPDIYQRLKEMEDRMKHLESISPEYANFWNITSLTSDGSNSASQLHTKSNYKYSSDDILQKIEEMESQAI